MIDNNKVLVIVIVPTMNLEYSIFIPIGRSVGSIKKQLIKTIEEQFDEKILKDAKLYDKETSKVFEENILVKNTNIRNGTKLLLV